MLSPTRFATHCVFDVRTRAHYISAYFATSMSGMTVRTTACILIRIRFARELADRCTPVLPCYTPALAAVYNQSRPAVEPPPSTPVKNDVDALRAKFFAQISPAEGRSQGHIRLLKNTALAMSLYRLWRLPKPLRRGARRSCKVLRTVTCSLTIGLCTCVRATELPWSHTRLLHQSSRSDKDAAVERWCAADRPV
jgi:hypothetical protein